MIPNINVQENKRHVLTGGPRRLFRLITNPITYVLFGWWRI